MSYLVGNEEKILAELAVLRSQQSRLVADIESEKGNRNRIHTDMQHQIDKVETKVDRALMYVFIGMGMAISANLFIMVLLTVVLKLTGK